MAAELFLCSLNDCADQVRSANLPVGSVCLFICSSGPVECVNKTVGCESLCPLQLFELLGAVWPSARHHKALPVS